MKDFAHIESLVASGQIIMAIKEYRTLTGIGLKDAKHAVDGFRSHGRWPHQAQQAQQAQPSPAVARAGARRAEIERHMADRKKIMAIKALREITGWGLRDAKNAADHYQAHEQWPANVLAVFGDSPHADSPPPEPSRPRHASGKLAEIEQLVANRQKIQAIKLLREVTHWGLRETKDAVDDYQADGHWAAHVLDLFEDDGASAPPSVQQAPPSAQTSAPSIAQQAPPAAPSEPASEPVGAAPTDGIDMAPIIAVLTDHLGPSLDVRLTVRAERIAYEGVLVMLGDRACFVYDQFGRWSVGVDIAYADVTDVDIRTGLGAELYVSVGYLRERFGKMTDEDAEAALALFRVFAS